MFDRVVAYGTPRLDPAFLAAAGSPPPDGIGVEQAITAAVDYVTRNGTLSSPVVVLSAAAGPRSLVDDEARSDESTWVWAVHVASEDGYQEFDVFVDYAHGAAFEARGGSVRLP